MRAILLLCALASTWTYGRGEERCCEYAGCFNNNPPLNELPVPQCPETLNIKFQLFTRNNRDVAEAVGRNELGSNFDGSRRTMYVSHGWLGEANEDPWIAKLKNRLLDHGDYNVVVVDWNEAAGNIDYPQVASNTRSVGAETALVMANQVNNGGASYSNMHCMGHSLGGHVCGHTGKRAASRINRITGFDPAGPLFETIDVSGRVDRGDADFVDIIHTATEGFATIELGIEKAVGHADFYPNNARCQPGCIDCSPSARDIVAPQIAVCSHFRAIDFFSESLASSCPFTSYPCASKDDATNGICNNCDNGCQSMGIGAQENGGQGTYYLATNPNEPFCQG